MQTTPDADAIAAAVAQLKPYMIESLTALVRAPSLSGQEEKAVHVMERLLHDLGLTSEHLFMDSQAIKNSPLFSCPCNPDNGRYNLLATYSPPSPESIAGKSILFNGHLDVVPTGPEDLWSRAPFDAYIQDDWLYGRGAGDMKAGLVCALAAFKALQIMGLRPAARIGFNTVVDEEDTGNGTLASIGAIQSAMVKAKLTDFDTVIIPEPFGETLMSAQVGVCWLNVEITGRPAHVAYMNTGLNPIEAAMALVTELKKLQATMNLPENRHPAFAHVEHPIAINLGTIEGGEWKSSVPCTCTLGIRAGFYPDVTADEAIDQFTTFIHEACQRLGAELTVRVTSQGFRAPGCVFDLEHPAMKMLAHSHKSMHGQEPERYASTATTDGRHFRLMTDMAVTNYGPLAKDIHGIDECVSLSSMERVTQTLVHYIISHCGATALEK